APLKSRPGSSSTGQPAGWRLADAGDEVPRRGGSVRDAGGRERQQERSRQQSRQQSRQRSRRRQRQQSRQRLRLPLRLRERQ
ncbi:MAG TPA: hypothetical protein DEF51_29980, partial [Myxococcales bacterium]|nr:hypothetical protein [Myxococcales bacterium]